MLGAFISLAIVFKLLVIAVLAPMWYPIAKELWKEVNASLSEDGGVFGRQPDEHESEVIGRKRRQSGESLVSVRIGEESGTKAGPRTARGKVGRPGRTRSGKPAPKKRGF